MIYRNWIVKHISYGVQDVNDYIRWFCYQVNKISKEELFFKKFDIKYKQIIQASYDHLDITKYRTTSKFKNQVETTIEYDKIIYKVKICSYGLQICNVQVNPYELMDHVSKTLGLKFLKIETVLVSSSGKLKTLSQQDYINHPNANVNGSHLHLKFPLESIIIYNYGKFVISSRSLQQVVKLYTDLYIHSDLKKTLQLLFQLKSSWFSKLPLDLYNVIINFLYP